VIGGLGEPVELWRSKQAGKEPAGEKGSLGKARDGAA
jgi:hypothetical protein